jgi:competence ComEA-like helix-hairpin-helix protein
LSVILSDGSGLYLQPGLNKMKNLSRARRAGGCPMRCLCAWGFSLVMLLALASSAFAQKKPPAKPIDINTASEEQLQQLPGVGPVIARSIFDFRRKSGPFKRPEDLLSIRGISANRYRAIAPYIVVSQVKPPTAAAKPASAKPSAPASGTKPDPAKPAAPSK